MINLAHTSYSRKYFSIRRQLSMIPYNKKTVWPNIGNLRITQIQKEIMNFSP